MLNSRIFLKIFSDGITPLFSSVTFYSSSDWLEREIWDLYGLKFVFHPSLRRILTDYGFKGYPLRKDFPVIGFVELFYDDANQTIKIDLLESNQQFRGYMFLNPWHKVLY